MPGYFQQAKSAAEAKEDPEIKAQLLGFILYNYARHLLQNEQKPDEAKQYYIEAGKARIEYFMALRSRGVSAEDSIMKGAATQVWKIRQDWPAFFGEDTIGQCPVTEELFRLLEEQYSVNPRFSATRSA